MSTAPLAGVGPDPAGLDDDRVARLEWAAIAIEAMKWNTPDAVAGMMTAPAQRAELMDRWLGLDAPKRGLYRRRAAIARAALEGDL